MTVSWLRSMTAAYAGVHAAHHYPLIILNDGFRQIKAFIYYFLMTSIHAVGLLSSKEPNWGVASGPHALLETLLFTYKI